MGRIVHVIWFLVTLFAALLGYFFGATKDHHPLHFGGPSGLVLADRDHPDGSGLSGIHDSGFLVRMHLFESAVPKLNRRDALNGLVDLHEHRKLIGASARKINNALDCARMVTIQRSSVIFEIVAGDSKKPNYAYVKVSQPDGEVSAVEFGFWD